MDAVCLAEKDLAIILGKGVAPQFREPLNDSHDALAWLAEVMTTDALESNTPGAMRIVIAAVQAIWNDLVFDVCSARNGGYTELSESLDSIIDALYDAYTT